MNEINPILIIGSGRSGTNFMGQILNSHPEIRCTIEDPIIFPLAVKCSRGDARVEDLVKHYLREMENSAPLIYADKSHTNLWIVEELRRHLPAVKFISMQRDLLPTVSSMLQHPDPDFAYSKWRPGFTPSFFKGDYKKCAQIHRCVLRHMAIQEVIESLDDNFVMVFEDLVKDPDSALGTLQHFLGLPEPFPRPKIDQATLTKWQSGLQNPDEASEFSEWVKGNRQDPPPGYGQIQESKGLLSRMASTFASRSLSQD